MLFASIDHLAVTDYILRNKEMRREKSPFLLGLEEGGGKRHRVMKKRESYFVAHIRAFARRTRKQLLAHSAGSETPSLSQSR